MEPDIILASASPRRVMLLERAGITFRQVPSDAEEYPGDAGNKPSEVAERNALTKAVDIAEKHPDSIVIGADTIVVSTDGEILGKPVDRDDAFRILELLSDTTQSVITGVAILCVSKNVREVFSENTAVTMREMSHKEIEEYIDSGEPFGKAGAYAIQGTGDRFVESVDGDFNNVVGLPLEKLLKILDHLNQQIL